MPSKHRAWLITTWLVVFGAAAAQLMANLRVDSDLSAFMPRARTDAQALLLTEIESGPASRLWLLAIRATEQTRLSELSRRFAIELEATGHFTTVYSGQTALDAETRQVLFRYRYLLDPGGETSRFAEPVLRRAFEDGLERLRSPAAPFEKRLLSSDPTGALRRVIDSLQPPSVNLRRRDGAWLSADGSQAFLLAESTADGTDLDAQERIAAAIAVAFAAAGDGFDADLLVSGPPAFAVATKARIQREALMLSLTSSALLIAILMLVFRSVSRVLLVSVPLAGGVLLATAVTTTIWGSVHGISLAFGATLLGVALDYPVHLVSHARPGEPLARSVPRMWPTLRLGVLTTVLGFAAMLTTDFPGIQQLAVFSISGLIAAALLTRYLLAPLFAVPARSPPRLQGVVTSLGRSAARAWWLAPIIVIAALVQAWRDPSTSFASRVDALSPVPASLVAQDRSLRMAMGLAEPGYVLLVFGQTVDTMLQRQEMMRPVLRQASTEGLLRGFDMAANVLPSASLQRDRRDALPDAETLQATIDAARQGLPFRADAFAAFANDIAAARALEPLDSAVFAGTLLGTRLDGLIRHDTAGVVGIVTLSELNRPDEFAQLVDSADFDGVQFIDIKSSTSDLVNAYRDDILLRSALALVLIAGILTFALRDRVRLLRVLLPVLGAVLTAAALPVLLGQALNVFHLVSLLVVAGIGLDYALFFSHSSADALESVATRHSLLVCALSTVTVFTVLSLSRIPVLNSIGITVATGTVSAFLLSGFMNRSNEDAEAQT